MKTVKFSEPLTCNLVREACISLENGKRKMNEGKREADAAKEIIARLLRDEREIEIDQLPIGETVVVQCANSDTLRIVIKSQKRFDQKDFITKHFALAVEFTRAFPTVNYDVTDTDILTETNEKIDSLLNRAESVTK